ncbi:hypothetical protein BH10BAC2_BH10BAC2_28230 [soil metagenome]
MKKWTVAIIVTGTIFSLLYALVYFFVIPQAAEFSLPVKWKSVVTGLKKNDYELYLGSPLKNATPGSDKWILRNGNYTFSLSINYNQDSIANTVDLRYTFSNYLFHKEGYILRGKDE